MQPFTSVWHICLKSSEEPQGTFYVGLLLILIILATKTEKCLENQSEKGKKAWYYYKNSFDFTGPLKGSPGPLYPVVSRSHFGSFWSSRMMR